MTRSRPPLDVQPHRIEAWIIEQESLNCQSRRVNSQSKNRRTASFAAIYGGREAERRVKALRLWLERTALDVRGEESWKAAVVRWSTKGLDGVKNSVRTRYLSSIRRFDERFGSLLVALITTRDIADWISDRKRMGSVRAQGEGKAISNASIQRDLTALSRLLSFCCSIGWRTDNPVQAFDRTIIRERREPKRPLTRREIQIAINAAPPRVAGILSILAETGMRMNEAVMLERWQRG